MFSSTSGESVFAIPIETGVDDQPIWLPSPSLRLLRMLNSGGKRSLMAKELRLNPALLLFALARRHRDSGEPPNSATELIDWCKANLIGELAAALDCQTTAPHSQANDWHKQPKPRFFENLLRARSNRKLRRALNRFLRSVTQLEKSDRRQWVNLWVGDQLRADDFKCKRVRHKKTLNELMTDWSAERSMSIDIQGLLRLVHEKQQQELEFDSQLQTAKLLAMKELAYGASHEINNPLANIATRAQTMLAVETDAEKRHKLAVIYEQAMRAHEMISDMMLFAHPPAIEVRLTSLRILMAKIVQQVRPLTETVPGLVFHVTVGAGIDRVEIDATHLTVAIKNLVRNSVEAIQSASVAEPQIDIRIDRRAGSPDEVQISVWDNGIGITEAVAEHMFDPFYSGREAGRGLGFGLSKIWTIAKLHGGLLEHDHECDRGTRFVLRIPLERKEIFSKSELTSPVEFAISSRPALHEGEAA